LDKLPEELEDRSVEGVLYVGGCEIVEMVDKLARALEVFWAKAAKERRLRREIEPTTDPVKVVEDVGGSVVGGKVVVVVVEVEARKRFEGRGVVESGTEGSGYGRDSSR
jgi:hypothetical protein